MTRSFISILPEDATKLVGLVVRITALALSIQLVISYQLWVPSEREFPLVSAFEWLPVQLGLQIDLVLYCLTLSSLALLLLKPAHWVAILLLVCAIVLFILEDISRLQPWLYFDLLFLLCVASCRDDGRAISCLLRILLAATYFWSGIQKLNYAFTVEVVPWLAGSIGLEGFFAAHPTVSYLFPLFEAMIGAGLLIPRLTQVAVFGGMAMHLFLLWAFGPFGNNWNAVIWPWNVQMVIMLLALRRMPQIAWKGSRLKKDVLRFALILLVGALPVFNFFGLVDHYLSGSLYSASTSEGIFCYDSLDRSRLPQSARKFAFTNDSLQIEFVTLDQWFMSETQVPFYPEERYYRRIGRSLSRRMSRPEACYVLLNEKDRFTSDQHLKRVRW